MFNKLKIFMYQLPIKEFIAKYYFVCIWLVTGFIFVSTIIGIIKNYSPVPYWDQWNGSIDFIKKLLETKDVSALFAHHNEHWIIIPRIFFLLDYYLSSSDNVLLFVSIFIILLVSAWFYIRIFNKMDCVDAVTRRFVYAVIIACFVSWVQEENLTWGFQIQFIIVFVFAVVSFYFLVMYNTVLTPKAKKKYLLLAMLFSVLSSFSMANGILAFPLLVFLAFILKMPIRTKIIVSVHSLFFIIIHFLYFPKNLQHHANPLSSLTEKLYKVILYTCIYMGNVSYPILKNSVISALVGVFFIIALCGIVFFIMYNKKKINSIQIFLLVSILFIIGTAFVSGLGRINFGLGQALSGRYASPVLFAYVSFILLFFSVDIPFLLKPTKVIIVTLFVLALILPQRAIFKSGESVAFRRSVAMLSVFTQTPDKKRLAELYHDFNGIMELSPFLDKHDLSLYKTKYNHLLGKKLKEKFEIVSNGSCMGNFDKIIRRPDINNSGAEVSGWSWDVKRKKIFKTIVIVNSNDIIVGLALTGNKRDDVANDHKDITDRYSGWTGYVQKKPGIYYAYALDINSNSACRLDDSQVVKLQK